MFGHRDSEHYISDKRSLVQSYSQTEFSLSWSEDGNIIYCRISRSMYTEVDVVKDWPCIILPLGKVKLHYRILSFFFLKMILE